MRRISLWRKTVLVFAALCTLTLSLGWSTQSAQAGQVKVLYSGNPRYQEEPLIGDKGFVTDYEFGDTIAPLDGRIVGGPFARQFDQAQEGIRDKATYLVVIKGSGRARIGATDFKMFDGDHFGFYEEEVTLSEKGSAFTFYWPGLKKEGDSYNGYGFEVIVLQAEGKQAVVTHIELILLGPGDLTK